METIHTNYKGDIQVRTQKSNVIDNVVNGITDNFSLYPEDIKSIYISTLRIEITLIDDRVLNFAMAGTYMAKNVGVIERLELEAVAP